MMSNELVLKLPARGQTVKAVIWGPSRTKRWNGTAMVNASAISSTDWAVGMIDLTEDATSDGIGTGTYVGSFPPAEAGEYYIEFFTGSSPSPGQAARGVQVIYWLGTSATNLESVAADVDAIRERTDKLVVGQITLMNPLSKTGILTLVRGDDYTLATNKAILFEDTGATCPDLTGASVKLTIRSNHTDALQMSVVGTVLAPRKIRFEPTHADTTKLVVGSLAAYYDVQAVLPDGSVVTPFMGYCTVVRDATHSP